MTDVVDRHRRHCESVDKNGRAGCVQSLFERHVGEATLSEGSILELQIAHGHTYGFLFECYGAGKCVVLDVMNGSGFLLDS